MAMSMPAVLVTAVIAIAAALVTTRFVRRSLLPKGEAVIDDADVWAKLPEPDELSQTLSRTIPGSVVLPSESATFKTLMKKHWAQQERDVFPSCFVLPSTVQELSTAVAILKQEFDRHQTCREGKGLFAIRSGGHSPLPGSASISGGVVIDMGRFDDIVLSEDESTVELGAGQTWGRVTRVLGQKSLAVVGGRNGDVGVGGLCLGGGVSFFSSRFGLVCSNIISYRLVLASGDIVVASATENPDLWRALKGGGNNFGIVTHFTIRTFPCNQIWSGYLYIPSFQARKVLTAFHEFVSRRDSVASAVSDSSEEPLLESPTQSRDTLTDNSGSETAYDKNASGPIACFSYVQQLGIQVISVNLVYTDPVGDEEGWFKTWRTSKFLSLWRFWNTCKLRSLNDAYDEMSSLNPPGRRQIFAGTTIKNDAATIAAAHAVYEDSVAALRYTKVKGLVWTLVFQPFLPVWARLGDPNPLGLDDGSDDPLVIVSFTVNWNSHQDDELVRKTLRQTMEQIESAAMARGTAHRFKYMNYCADWQNPFESYGTENFRFLQEMSRRYDPDGLFQRGCVGGFKLDQPRHTS